MTRANFSTWKIPYLQEFLVNRELNRTGTKEMLVRNCFSAYELGLQETGIKNPSHLPNTLYDVQNYLMKHDPGKAFKSGKSLSRHSSGI